MAEHADVVLSICLRCRDGRESDTADLSDRGGRRLADAVTEAFGSSRASEIGVELRGVHCMSLCKRPCTIALSSGGRYTYLFGDLDPETAAAAVLDVAALYAEAEDGVLARSDRPPAMRSGILGRIPPLGFSGDAVEPLFPPSPTSKKAPVSR